MKTITHSQALTLTGKADMDLDLAPIGEELDVITKV